MHELGAHARRLHSSVGRQIAAYRIDLLITVGPLARSASVEANRSGMATESFESLDQAKQVVSSLLRAGDIVLLKASRLVGLDALVEPIRQVWAGQERPRVCACGEGKRR